MSHFNGIGGSRPKRTAGRMLNSSLNRNGSLRPLPPAPPAAPPPAKKDRKYPEIRQRGYYSDILGEGASERLGNVLDGPRMVPDLLWQARTEKHMPSMTTFQSPTSEQLQQILKEQVHGPTSQIIKETDFPERSYEPKVQVPFYTPPGSCPRKIEIERRKREYAKKNLDELLEKNGIRVELLMPRRQDPAAKATLTTPSGDSKGRHVTKLDPFPPILPLEVFDDEDFDVRRPEEWLSLGDVDPKVRKPVPGKALLPTVSAQESTDLRNPELVWEWMDVGVLDLDVAKKLFLVQKCDGDGRVLDREGKTVINGARDEQHPGQFWIPRVQLMFCAENPELFAKRVRYAFKARRKTESLLRYHLYIDCMPMDGLGELSETSFMKMLEWAKGAPSIAKDYRVDRHVPTLKRQVTIDWCRAMNRIIFDKTIKADRATYSYITLPDPVVEKIPYRGCDPDVPPYNFPKQFNEFAFNSLLTREEAIQAIQRVRTECQKVASMQLFHVPMSKTQRLEEFDQTQSQASNQTSLFLKDSWITTLRAAIRTCLRDVGKGWFNLHETNWQVYQISKLKKFMDMVKFSMQDSLRYLVQDSLNAFVQMALDACCTVMELKEGEFVWGEDVLNSQFRPLRNALFLVELILDGLGVHYSTNLMLFEQSLATLFDKGIQSTHNVPQLEKYVLEDMFWSGTPLLESVGLHEPFVESLRDTLRHAIQQALIPMKAYATEFERHLELMNCDVNQYINQWREARGIGFDLKRIVNEDDDDPATYEKVDRTAHEIKADVERHLHEKELIELGIPSSIVIGPFHVLTENVRQALSKKRKALANALLELLARILRSKVDSVSDEFKTISRKLYDKPNTIEELADQREWMKSIPDLLAEKQERIDQYLSEYELLDEFLFGLPQDDFNAKWVCIGWPHKIEIQMEQTYRQLEEDEERFHKMQLTDQANFNDRLDTLQMVVAGMAAHVDINKSHEVANEVRRINKQLKECQDLAAVYNNRERLFGMAVTNYEKLARLVKEFEPFRNLWITASNWITWHESWMHDPITTVDAESLEKNVNDAYKTMHKSVKFFADIPGVSEVAAAVKETIEEFKPHIPLIQGLRNPGMRARHWEQLSNELGFDVQPTKNLNFLKCLEMGLQEHMGIITKIAEVAGKEYSIEQALDKMESEWKPVIFEILPYKDTGTYILKASDETSQLLDDHIVMTQSMSFSPYKKPFEDRITQWENKLKMTQDVLDEWLMCQRSWLYLEPIFSSEDINRQLPVESKRYQTMERIWRKLMKTAESNPIVIVLCPDARLLENLRECNKLLEQVQKGLSEYLETKRTSFPRFFFLSDDELLEILSQTKDPTAVQPHLRKCFENIAQLNFEEDLCITDMFSSDGEKVPFCEHLYPTGNVEDWLLEVERVMRDSLRKILGDSLEIYSTIDRTQWVLSWPGQVVIAGCQIHWTMEVTEALENNQLPQLQDNLLKQLDDLRGLVRSPLTRMQRSVLSALIVIEVHARDVVGEMLKQNVSNSNDFEWISQLRYYWVSDNLKIRVVNAEFQYGYEYLGNSGRLVITPLTDRCYLTLSGALHLKFGGAPAGPAGTGKTETTKDLGKAMAIQCVVFNCSDQLDYMAMGKFFKGLASAGAWSCFDEFNRIDIEVLSVIAMQITTIQQALKNEADRFIFEGVELVLKVSCAVFITMNPGYAGRTELPDNLKALFRPVAMMVPDYGLIAEISLFSFGFAEAKLLALKIVTTFKLSSEQLSSQDHYDFGMRAVKTVISAAGNLKRENPEMVEELICLRAIRDVNVPKFLQDDLKLFNGIVTDLFPKINFAEQSVDYGILDAQIRKSTKELGMKDVDGFLNKCIQLYETTVVRHGLMLVGPTGSGKTKCYEILKESMSGLKGEMSPSGSPFETVHTFVLNPKSITMGQLYGEFDLMTHEWTDGILSSLIRGGTGCVDTDKRWYVFDGPVDAIWIENMNTVLDDNKKLCLSSGEIIKLSDNQTMMFEVSDLAVASPATVSRCGMVYLEPSILGLTPFVECWLGKLPDTLIKQKKNLERLFDKFLQPAITFLRLNMKEIVSSVDSNLTFSLLKLMDCFFAPFIPKENKSPMSKAPATSTTKKAGKKEADDKSIPPEKLERVPELIEPWFLFSLVWSVGATCDNDGRVLFDKWLRGKIVEEKCKLPFPAEGLVYDYRLDDGGASNLDKDDDDDDDYGRSGPKKKEVKWADWMAGLPEFTIAQDARFSDIIVPTQDTTRGSVILEMLLKNNKSVLSIGPTGTGKTLTIADKLTKAMPKDFIPDFIVFSAKTSSNQTQDLIDSKLDKRRKGVFGPPLGKYLIFFIDDLNMPALEPYGAQPPIELIRQWMDFKGWYDRKAIGEFRHLVDVNFLCAMGPPGGGRNPVTPRLTRHFNYLSFSELQNSSKTRIFGVILNWWLEGSPENKPLCEQMVKTCLHVYSTIQSSLLPTPAKSHYTFNLRDLSKVFQGISMADGSAISDKASLLRLWYHENCRVFQDRLVNNEDRDWFKNLLFERIKQDFHVSPSDVVVNEPILFGDFMNPNADAKMYMEITDHAKLITTIEEYLEDYNQITVAKMNLVLFMDAIKHVCRINRVIRQPLGNALLLGMGGSGRQSLTRLASHMADYDCFQVELSKNYGVGEWREDLKGVMMKTGLENKPLVFLFSDTQIKSESFLEDLNNILNSGDVPNIYAFDELDQIYTAMKPLVQDGGLQPTKTNLYATYTKRVRSNLHTVVTMSPLGEVFRARLRQFPALVNCCTIDWFSEWPKDALQSVAMKSFDENTELNLTKERTEALVFMCQQMHQSVATRSIEYKEKEGRFNYVTPTSFLELLNCFRKLNTVVRSDLVNQRDRTKTGLDKLMETQEQVDKLQQELEFMKPMLEDAARETAQTMEQIAVDTKVAEETKVVVQREEAQAGEKAKETQAIADDAQKDLNEALPALDAALNSLRSLNKNDVVEVRAMQRPPDGVRMVIEAVCIMKGIKPKRVQGDKPGVKVDDYWEPGKALLQDPAKFLESLFKYDKENIPDATIQKIQTYIDSESFTPSAISKVSKACTSICSWVRAMHKYHFVAKAVAPKRAALAEAQGELAETQAILDAAKSRLSEVEEGIATLQAKYNDCVNKKEELERKCQECEERLVRADKLIGGLADEKGRWAESVTRLDKQITSITGSVLVGAGFVAYLGPFNGPFREMLTAEWEGLLDKLGVPNTGNNDLIHVLGDPVKIRSWQIAGLPKDTLSVENGIIVQYSQRWPLFIDPQGQANKWIKNLMRGEAKEKAAAEKAKRAGGRRIIDEDEEEPEKDSGVDVIKLSDRDFLRSLENSIRFGKPCLLENVYEEMDPALEPVLLKQTYKQSGTIVIKLGDAIIPWHEDFRFYITTKLPNPHYTPEISTKVTLVNFTLSPDGLEDQLLARVVAEERPDLEEAKNQLIVSNAKMKQELKEIEDKILERLSASEGSPVDDLELIATLEASKVKSGEIKQKVAAAEVTEKEIDTTRSEYIPVAVRSQILFFCVSDLAKIDPMYQYSLEWFISIFLGGIANAEEAESVDERIVNINEYFTFSLYTNVCRSLFEKHKLLFAFLLCVRILQQEGKINGGEWMYLLAGGMSTVEAANPDPSWISEKMWMEFKALTGLPKFAGLATEFSAHKEGFKAIFDSSEPNRETLPGRWESELSSFQRLLILRCIRVDKVTNAMQDFVATNLGQRFIEPQTADLTQVFKDSSPTTPLIFVLSVGTDPAADLYKFADEMRFSKKLTAISLGQGQGPRAEAMMRSSMERGKWVFFQNCHLAPSWMPTLERLIEQIDPDKVHRDFRLWLTSMPSPKFPVAILQNSSKMTVEPPRGIKANLLKSYMTLNDDFLNSCGEKTSNFKHLLLSLCFFHAISLERRKFGPLGFNIPYEFTDGDLRICISQLKMFLVEYEETPYKVLKYTAGHINYGGRVTDDQDRRTIMTILDDFYFDGVLSEDHVYSSSGVYRQIGSHLDHASYIMYLRSLPINDMPEVFGLHDNANITFAQNETYNLLNGLLLLQPKSAAAAGQSTEAVIEKTTKDILAKIPHNMDLKAVMQKYPLMYEESMNTVLSQEIMRYNKLLITIHKSLQDLLKAIKGLVVMSQELEEMSTSLFINAIPSMWSNKAYPSLKPLASWVLDLEARMAFIKEWVDHGIPKVFWISGFFFPQAFLTGTMQNYARSERISIDTISFDFQMIRDPASKIQQSPTRGVYIRGLFIEGARWDLKNHKLTESHPKELFTDMPVIYLIPEADRVPKKTGVYHCPVYKTLTRAGTLSTTGHSTNFVTNIEIPTERNQSVWIKQGVALLCALNY